MKLTFRCNVFGNIWGLVLFFVALVFGFGLVCAQPAPAAKNKQEKTQPSLASVVKSSAYFGFKVPYSHFSAQEPIDIVLSDFARLQNFNAIVSPLITGKISGSFDNVDPKTFLEGMQAAFGVRWYSLGNAVYFYHQTETSKDFITPQIMSADLLFPLLQSSSVFSPQLPLAKMAGGNTIIVTGPKSYIEYIRNAVASFESNQASKVVMKVFKLKYAWAEDISVSSMDKTVTIPGVASILRAMVTGGESTGSQETQKPASVTGLLGSGLAAQGKAASAPTQAPASNLAPSNIIADPRVNAVIIHDAEYRMPYYEAVINDIDKPVELVEIHAAIVDIDVNFKRELGVNYQGGYKKDGGWGGSGDFSTAPGAVPSVPVGDFLGTGLNLSTIYTQGSSYFLARIQALEKDGEARVLGKPSVLTTDNMQATLENTSTYYIQVGGKDVVDLFKVEAGTVLRVTPHIIRDQAGGAATIKLAVNIQDDQDNSTAVMTAGMAIPPIKQTKINTQAIIGEGQSLLIGGYYYEQKTDEKSGIPILMHIPFLGNFFKTQAKDTRRMERLILITPTVIKLDQLPAPPKHIDDENFHRSPTQSNYEERVPVKKGGCAKI